MGAGDIRNALTVDVEDYYHVSAFEGEVRREEWHLYESRVEQNTYKLLDIFSAHGVECTFFVLGWVAERFPSLVRDIASRGHEVACHGYSHRLVYSQAPGEVREETVKSKRVLEDLIQAPIYGYRAASYSITKRSAWALNILVEAGFTYDSSIFPIRHDRYGMPGAPRLPHRMSMPGGQALIEFPLSTVELLWFRLPVAGGGYFRLYPYIATRAALASINDRQQQPFVFYLHPWELDPDQPRLKARWSSRFRHYKNLDKSESRLVRLLRDFRFTTARNVLGEMNLL
jgi:polysaccharide deacetylase family protein (PEP-CTERM system associated)